MALSDEEKLRLAKILRVPFADVDSYSTSGEPIESELRGHIINWTAVEGKYISFKSGGVTVDPEEKRRLIRQAVRDLLGHSDSVLPGSMSLSADLKW